MSTIYFDSRHLRKVGDMSPSSYRGAAHGYRTQTATSPTNSGEALCLFQLDDFLSRAFIRSVQTAHLLDYRRRNFGRMLDLAVHQSIALS